MNDILYHIILLPLKAISLMPFRILYGLSDLVYLILRYIIHYRHSVIKGNLERSFPEKDAMEIRAITGRFYRHLADCIFETIKLLHISDKQLDGHIKVHGGETIERLASDGRPIIVFLGHYGNWEWVQEVTRHYEHPKTNTEIYRPIRNKAIDKLMLRIRSRFGTIAIPQHKAVRALLRMSQERRQFLVGFLADQRPNSKNLHNWTTFLNQETAYATGGEEIGRRVGSHFVYLNIEKPLRGHYVMTFQEMSPTTDTSTGNPYTLLFLHLLEKDIRKAPEYWLWSHNRWKFDREGNIIHK